MVPGKALARPTVGLPESQDPNCHGKIRIQHVPETLQEHWIAQPAGLAQNSLCAKNQLLKRPRSVRMVLT